MLAPAQSIFTDGVERALTRETVEVPLVLGWCLQRILLIETHKRLAPLPRPLAPVAKSCSTLKDLENLLMGKGRFFSSCLALLARVSSLNCSSVFTTSTILSTLLTLSTDSQKLLKSHSHVRPHTQEPSRYWAATTLGWPVATSGRTVSDDLTFVLLRSVFILLPSATFYLHTATFCNLLLHSVFQPLRSYHCVHIPWPWLMHCSTATFSFEKFLKDNYKSIIFSHAQVWQR